VFLLEAGWALVVAFQLRVNSLVVRIDSLEEACVRFVVDSRFRNLVEVILSFGSVGLDQSSFSCKISGIHILSHLHWRAIR
jgi:hypothetical protein